MIHTEFSLAQLSAQELAELDTELAMMTPDEEREVEFSLASPRADTATNLQKPVNSGVMKVASKLGATVRAKQFAMAKTSILDKRDNTSQGGLQRVHTHLEQPLPKTHTFKTWRETDDNTKLMLAVDPFLNQAAALGYEVRTFTLILNAKISKRLDDGDSKALSYIRDEIVRGERRALGASLFLYGIEKAPKGLARNDSRRRWHIHGLIAGPAGFDAPGKTPLRKAWRSLKGEADSDLMFKPTGMAPEGGTFQDALRWAVYSSKDSHSVQLDPSIADRYDLPPGKATYISAKLRKATQQHHETIRRLIAG